MSWDTNNADYKKWSGSSDSTSATKAPCVIVMVGLPARGKTYMARKLTRYLNWVGIETKVFNVGEYRRTAAPESINCSEFFRGDNQQAQEIREKCAIAALEDVCAWLKGGGEVAVYDATNSVRKRRQMICDYLCTRGFKFFFVESICFDPDVIEANIREVKVSSPDYVNTDREQAIIDFRKRITHYEVNYETLDVEHDRELSFIKIFDQGEKYLVNGVRGHIESRCVYYLMNIHVLPRTIYLTRHGETDLNISGRLGTGGVLSPRGKQYVEALAKFVEEHHLKENLRVWTSIQHETIETAKLIDSPREHWKALNEIDVGGFEGMTYEEIMEKFPEEYNLREVDKFYYRYPSGESYQDLVTRLEPVIMELERRENVMVVSHQAVVRCLLAYFMDKDVDDLPYLEVPLHTVIKLTPIAYGCKVELLPLGIDAVSTQRPKPEIAYLAIPCLTKAMGISKPLSNKDLPPMTEEERKRVRRQSSGYVAEAYCRKRRESFQTNESSSMTAPTISVL